MEIFLLGVVGGLVVGGLGGWLVAKKFLPPAAPLFSDDEEGVEMMDSARAAVTERTERRLARIMAAATAAGQITNDGVEDLFCISDRTASTYLRQLTKEGKLKREGGGRSTFYTVEVQNT